MHAMILRRPGGARVLEDLLPDIHTVLELDFEPTQRVEKVGGLSIRQAALR